MGRVHGLITLLQPCLLEEPASRLSIQLPLLLLATVQPWLQGKLPPNSSHLTRIRDKLKPRGVKREQGVSCHQQPTKGEGRDGGDPLSPLPGQCQYFVTLPTPSSPDHLGTMAGAGDCRPSLSSSKTFSHFGQNFSFSEDEDKADEGSCASL